MNVPRWLAAGCVFGVLWVFVSGPDPTVHAVLTALVLGFLVGLPVAYVFRRLYEERFDVTRSVRALPAAVVYAALFSKEVLVANVDVAYRVLHPSMPLEPQVILVPLRVEGSLAITTIANSISVTPGTVTLDHDPAANALYVHGIDGRDPHAIVDPIRTWEDYALVVFDEDASPDDPAPEIRVHPPGGPPEPKRRGESAAEDSAAEAGDAGSTADAPADSASRDTEEDRQ